MPKITGVVKNLIIINVLIYLAAQVLLGDNQGILAFHQPGSTYFNPFQIVSHMFMHGSFNHLLFNMLSLFFLGPIVESRLGSKKFLFLYLFSGFGALLTHVAIAYLPSLTSSAPFMMSPVWGASGAVYGVLIALAVLFPNLKMMLLFPPIPIKAKVLALVLIAIGLYMGMTGRQSGIAHFAHLGGALFSFLLLLYWRSTGKVV